MSDDTHLRQLYRDTVLAHSRVPHNFRRIEGAQASAQGHNPLCGDKVTVYLRLSDSSLADAAFQAAGCAISLASASMLTDMVGGRTLPAAQAIAADVLAMLETGASHPELGEINALSGVRAYPSRIRCATLPWRTLQAALSGSAQTVTTESEVS